MVKRRKRRGTAKPRVSKKRCLAMGKTWVKGKKKGGKRLPGHCRKKSSRRR